MHTPRYITEKGKTGRAFGAYLDLLDAADWIREEMGRQLAMFDLTIAQFRVLEALWREGPHYQQAMSNKFKCSKQAMAHVLRRLERSGWIARAETTLPRTKEARKKSSAKAKRGRRITEVRLTAEGERLIGRVYPRHAKMVKAEMRVLEGREQGTLSRLCRKLMQGDVLKFYKEIRMKDLEEFTGPVRR